MLGHAQLMLHGELRPAPGAHRGAQLLRPRSDVCLTLVGDQQMDCMARPTAPEVSGPSRGGHAPYALSLPGGSLRVRET